jgi:two-component system, sensor histidine kinase and response regulator
MPTPDTSVLDQAALDELRACDPDGTGLLAELVEIYLSDTPPRLNAIRLAFDAGQPQALAREAHALKSSSAQLGARALADACRQLEAKGREGTLEGAAEIVARLQPDFDAAKAALLASIR